MGSDDDMQAWLHVAAENGHIPVAEFWLARGHDGWVALIFDTRPDAMPDGEWNSFIDKNLFERRHWRDAVLALENGAVEVLLLDGTKRKIAGESEFDEFVALLGDLLTSVLRKARADGVFKSLPKAEECHLMVEEQEGRYGWPAHADRGKDDLA